MQFYVIFQVLTAVTMKNGVFWDVVFLISVRRLLVVPRSSILVILMKVAPSFSKASVLTRDTQRNIQEDAILYAVSLSRYLF
jgi:hypothetical protein